MLALLAAAVALVLPAAGPAHAISRASQTMYTSPSTAPSPGALYPRGLRLQYSGSSNGTMLATFEQYSSGTPVFPIYRSTDNGNSWTQISSITDTHNGFGMRYQPQLYELPTQIGNFPAGTILAAGNSIPNDLSSTELDLYASTDHGMTWSFVSSIAQGGRADVTNGETPVWEPFLMVSGSKLIVYYSDQRDPNHAQK
ncbi:MAG: ricin-type beta-trefoil lectin domain protein, partial [Streptomyces sp.]|nr:ricin-type beta-trefoil lectin domain protein [Streptomyces sp.]